MADRNASNYYLRGTESRPPPATAAPCRAAVDSGGQPLGRVLKQGAGGGGGSRQNRRQLQWSLNRRRRRHYRVLSDESSTRRNRRRRRRRRPSIDRPLSHIYCFTSVE